MAAISVILAAARKGERRALAKWDPTIEQYLSSRRLYPVQAATNRREWRDGQRLLLWWVREVWEAVVYTVRPKAETTHTSGVRAAKAKESSIRHFQLGAAAIRSNN
jgi:hypothetical protein